MSTRPEDPLADEIARLYGLPPEEFVAARNAAAKAARTDGRKDDAATIAALRKPSAIESALNRTARHDPEATAAWVAATRAADAAQSASIGGADATALRAAVKDLRVATGTLVDAAVVLIGDPTKRDDLATLLRNVPVGAVDQVLRGVLGSAERTEAELFAGAPTPPPRPARPRRGSAAARTARAKASPTPTTGPIEPAAPPPPPKPSRRERTLLAAVERGESALADAVAARDTVRSELDAARRRLDAAEQECAAAETALAGARRELRDEQESRGA